MTTGWHTGIGGRTIHRDGRLVGLLDTPELADLVVTTLNTATNTAGILSAIHRLETKLMTALEDLQAADTELGAEVTALVTEQATFLTDIAARLANAPDPAAVAAVAADVQAQAAKLHDLAAAQAAADPGAPPAV